jgi:hypothetical protein
MTRFLLALLGFGLLAAAPQEALAACRWFGTQLECPIGASQMSIGTQAAAEPTYANPLRPRGLHGSDGLDELLDDHAVPEWPVRLDLQNVGVDARLCRKVGNEIYCY